MTIRSRWRSGLIQVSHLKSRHLRITFWQRRSSWLSQRLVCWSQASRLIAPSFTTLKKLWSTIWMCSSRSVMVNHFCLDLKGKLYTDVRNSKCWSTLTSSHLCQLDLNGPSPTLLRLKTSESLNSSTKSTLLNWRSWTEPTTTLAFIRFKTPMVLLSPTRLNIFTHSLDRLRRETTTLIYQSRFQTLKDHLPNLTLSVCAALATILNVRNQSKNNSLRICLFAEHTSQIMGRWQPSLLNRSTLGN